MIATTIRPFFALASIVVTSMAATAQVPRSAPVQTPNSVGQVRPASPADPAEVTIEGCVARATIEDTTEGAPAFLLTDAAVEHDEAEAPRTSADSTVPTALMVRLAASEGVALEEFTGKRIKARGPLTESAAARADAGAAQAPLAAQSGAQAVVTQTLDVVGIEVVASSCAGPHGVQSQT